MRLTAADLTIRSVDGPMQSESPGAKTPSALSIAGSDPTGGAGIQADLQVFQRFGVHGMAVITALTVQDSEKVYQVLPSFPSVVLDQLRTLLRDLRPGAVKIGMLATDDVVRNVMLALPQLQPGTPIVIDPVLAASDRSRLLERRAIGSLQALLEGATLVTPNLHEAAELTERDTSNRRGCQEAAVVLLEEFGCKAALIKGGHRDGAPDDLLARRLEDGSIEIDWLAGERIEAGPVHGTGCALSSAIAALLARGRPLESAVAEARSFVAHGLAHATPLGGGARFLGSA